MQVCHGLSVVADEPNLIGVAGLVPAMALAEQAGLTGLLKAHLSVPAPSSALKARCVIGGMLAGADSIDDLDVLRHGGMDRVFTQVRAPSTLGTFVRAFTFGHVRQLDAVAARFVAGLCRRVPRLLGGIGQMAYVDIDDTIREVHGYAKAGAAYGYTHLKGLNAQVATISTPTAAPVIAAARLRKGNVDSGHGAPALITSALAGARQCGAVGTVLVRADSGYYAAKTVHAIITGTAWFSITAPQDKAVRAAIGRIEAAAWTPIRYPRAVPDPTTGVLISDADVAEIDYVAFTSKKKVLKVPCRLVVRRVKAQGRSADSDQGELFPAYRYHAFITNSALSTVAADAAHRDHAIVEAIFAQLKQGPLGHAPSGRFTANAAWLAFAAITFNLARALGALASDRHAKARFATIRTHLITIPARIATSGRQLRLHLPSRWPWRDAIAVLTSELDLSPPQRAVTA